MKTAKRVLAIVLSVMMIVGTCVIAASAADTLQAQINGGATTITLTKNTYETITVNRDLTIDLNGYCLYSAEGQAAIKITAGNVTVTNGQVLSRYANVPSEQMLQEVWTNSPPAIRLTGGSLTLDGVRLVGGLVRVPTTTEYIPSGSGVQSYNGATVTIKRSSIYGDYGVNNAVGHNTTNGGKVTIEDAIILAYTKAIKGDYAPAAGSEEIIAADRIAGVLNDGITLEAGEKKLIRNVFDERVIIVSKLADTLIEELGLDYPLITVTEGVDLAEVDADEIDYSWEGVINTDASYKLVPEAVVYGDGGSAALDAVDATRVTNDSQIRYRVEYLMGVESKPYITDIANYIDLNWWAQQADALYAQVKNNPRTTYVDSYQELIDTFGDLWYEIDGIGNEDIPGVGMVRDQQMYITLRQILVDLGGKVAYEADSRREFSFNDQRYKVYYGDNAVVPANGMYGILDRVDALRVQMETIIGGHFTNTNTWGTLAAWAYDNYPEVIDIAYDLKDVLVRLNNLLNPNPETDPNGAIVAQKIVEFAHATDEVALLGEGINNLTMILDMYEKALGLGDVNAVLDTVERNKSLIKPYTDKIVYVLENWETYITPDNFIDGDYVKTYSTIGSAELEEVEAADKLSITIFGEGGVTYSGGTLTTGTTYNAKDVDFVDSFTLTAVTESNDVEFLFWINTENGSNRIISSEPTFTMNTNYSRAIEAVFGYVGDPVAYFTNITGDIAGGPVNIVDAKVAVTSDIARPYVAGYAFQGWPGVADGAINASLANTAYFAGNSAFADPNAYYGPDGAILKINPNTSSLIITPTYSLGGPYQIKFVDLDGEVYTADDAMYSDVVSFTSSYDNVYWKDGDNIVCVTPNYNYQVIKEATFTAVAGPCPVDAVARVSGTLVKDGIVTFYVERSTTKAINTTGIVFSYENNMPVLDGENCKKATAKYNTQTGLYAPGFLEANLEGKTLYIRPYIEFTDGEVYYTPTAFVYP